MVGKLWGTIRRGMALVIGLALVFTQLALPVAALAAADVSFGTLKPQALKSCICVGTDDIHSSPRTT